MSNEKPTILVLGGTGFIGRNFVHYLVENDLISKIRVVDKVPPQTAWFTQKHLSAFSSDKVEFLSSNLINEASAQKAFTLQEGEFEYAVNFASETKYGQTDPVYKEGILKLGINCATEAVKHNVKRYIEISSGYMGGKSQSPFKESSKPEPWNSIAKYKLLLEENLRKIPDLNYVIIRPSLVYGVGDKQGLTSRCVIGAIYKHKGEMMKQLWTKDLKVNTVHVHDLCSAVWHLFFHGKVGEIYNVVDKGNTNQGYISDIISDIFNINHDFLGTTLSTVAKIDAKSFADEINDYHLSPWSEICNLDGIVHTPLNPYVDQEQLTNRNLCLDGSKLEATGFTYLYPELKKEHLIKVLEDYVNIGLFPASILK